MASYGLAFRNYGFNTEVNDSYNEMVRLSGKDINDLGNYKACNELEGARYVLVSTWIFFELTVGLCIPASCDNEDL